MIHESCMRFDIKVTGGDVLSLQQTNVIYVGELSTYTNFKLGSTDQHLFRGCHHHFHLATDADMTNAAGA